MDQTGWVAGTPEREARGSPVGILPSVPPSLRHYLAETDALPKQMAFTFSSKNRIPLPPQHPKYLMPGTSSQSSEILFLFLNFNLILFLPWAFLAICGSLWTPSQKNK